MEELSISCPYCGETIYVEVDISSGDQSYYEDCQVCCAPILMIVTEDEYGNVALEVKRDDD